MITENNKMYVKVIDTSGLDQDTIQKIEDKMFFTRWWYENETNFCELVNSKGDIIRIFPERLQPQPKFDFVEKEVQS